MEISLEQIELVKDRTGVSYKEAKESLEFANGNVVDAIIYIEENINKDYEKKSNATVDTTIKVIKDLLHKGDVTKIRILKGDDLILNVPVNVGAVATIVFPWGVVAAAIASAATKCRIEVLKSDGSVIDINEKAETVVETVKDKSGVIVDELKSKSSDLYKSAVEKGSEIYESTKDRVQSYIERVKDEKEFVSFDKEEDDLDGNLGSCDDDSAIK